MSKSSLTPRNIGSSFVTEIPPGGLHDEEEQSIIHSPRNRKRSLLAEQTTLDHKQVQRIGFLSPESGSISGDADYFSVPALSLAIGPKAPTRIEGELPYPRYLVQSSGPSGHRTNV